MKGQRKKRGVKSSSSSAAASLLSKHGLDPSVVSLGFGAFAAPSPEASNPTRVSRKNLTAALPQELTVLLRQAIKPSKQTRLRALSTLQAKVASSSLSPSDSSDSSSSSSSSSSPSTTQTTDSTNHFQWDDPLVMLGISILISMISTITSWKYESSHYLDILRGLRSGTVDFTNKNRNDIRIMDAVQGMGATGLLGFSIGWHFGVQLCISTIVALLCLMLSLTIRTYTQLISTPAVTLPSGSVELLGVALFSFVLLVTIERHCLGAHRCLRPRHLLSCMELSGVMLYSVTALLLSMPYTLGTSIVRLVTHRTPPPFIQAILQKAAENYERNNNPIVRLTCALTSRASVGRGLEWDKEYVHAEASLSTQEKMVNTSLRLFWFLVENPHMIQEAAGTHTFGSGLKETIRNQRILKSFPNMLLSEQFQMLQVAFNMLDNDSDGVVTLRDLRCTAATIPELLGMREPELYKIIQIIGVESMSRHDRPFFDDDNDGEGEGEGGGGGGGGGRRGRAQDDGFSFSEWISFIRHRLFLCDMAHHGPGARDARLYGIELRKLRGQLEGALKIQRIHSSKSLASSSAASVANTEYQSQADLAKSKKSLERSETMMTKAVALSGTISETEMVFWGAKIPELMFEKLAERLGCCRPPLQKQQIENQRLTQFEYHSPQQHEKKKDQRISEEEEVCVNSKKLRPLIRACLGTTLDTRLGDLILDALQGGGEVATIKSLRTSYILSHSTGCRLAHVGKRRSSDDADEEEDDEEEDYDGEEDYGEEDYGEEENDEEKESIGAGKGKEQQSEWTNYQEQKEVGAAENNQEEELTRIRKKKKKKKKKQRERKNGELGKEKQLLSFVSRSLLPHIGT